MNENPTTRRDRPAAWKAHLMQQLALPLQILLPLLLTVPILSIGMIADSTGRVVLLVIWTVLVLAGLASYLWMTGLFITCMNQDAKEPAESAGAPATLTHTAMTGHGAPGAPAALSPNGDATDLDNNGGQRHLENLRAIQPPGHIDPITKGTDAPDTETDPLPNVDCIIDSTLWQSLKRTLKTARKEQGGILLGFRRGGKHFFTAAIFPEQVRNTAVVCEFTTADVLTVRDVLDSLQTEPGIERLEQVSWVHTHPNLTVFFSGTDKNTFQTQWSGLDPKARAVVIDAYQPTLVDQISAFDTQFRKEAVDIADVPLPDSLAKTFSAAIEAEFAELHRPKPFVVLAAVGPVPTATNVAKMLEKLPDSARRRLGDRAA